MNEDPRVLYEQKALPLFQNRMYATEPEAIGCPKGDVRLVEDMNSGLVYNAAFQPERMVYDAAYQNEQGVSLQFQTHLREVAKIVGRGLGRDRLIEVGCGKGFFLEMLAADGIDITGFDPTYEGSNPDIKRHYFDPDAGMHGKGLILRHVLEHIADPVAFLARLRDANNGGGRIYIEVPCFDWICRHRAWFDIFYEHANYFRLSDFHRMFGTVIESGHLFGDQYIYVVADLATLRPPRRDPADPVAFPADFTRTLFRPASSDGEIAIWGGASKGVIFALLNGRAGRPVRTVIDINPAKQGRHLAATGLRVQSPEEALPTLPRGSSIYVMNSNYLDEIRHMSGHAYTCIGVDHE